MDLRSGRRDRENAEFLDLKIMLSGLGFYEEGMQLQEMREVLAALEESTAPQQQLEENDNEMQSALKESDMDSVQMQGDDMLSSTMLSSHNYAETSARRNSCDQYSHSTHSTSSLSEPSSPEPFPRIICVEAEVHHPIDWSPTPQQQRLQRKRSSSADDGPAYLDLRDAKLLNLDVLHSDSHRMSSDSGVNVSSDMAAASSSLRYDTTSSSGWSNSCDSLASYNEFGRPIVGEEVETISVVISSSSVAVSSNDDDDDDDYYDDMRL